MTIDKVQVAAVCTQMDALVKGPVHFLKGFVDLEVHVNKLSEVVLQLFFRQQPAPTQGSIDIQVELCLIPKISWRHTLPCLTISPDAIP